MVAIGLMVDNHTLALGLRPCARLVIILATVLEL